MKNIGHTGARITGLALFGLASLSAPGLAGAHGAPDVEGVPEGIVKASISERSGIEGLNSLILDATRPGIMLRYQGDASVTVLDSQGEDFLRFTRNEVQANTQSDAWNDMPQSSKTGFTEGPSSADQGRWVTLSGSGSYGWMDSRLNQLAHDGLEPTEAATWSIPVRTETGEAGVIRGNLKVRSLKTASTQ